MPEGSRPASLSRVPPNNLRAEESVLGAMLLSREAIAEVVEILEPDHFYKPAHGHLYDAMLSLYSGGEPVDAVTVAEELKRAGLLDEVGGPAVLLDFQATTPAISNAAHYAKIVEEHALLRRMIAVSNEIAETAYGIPEDVIKAVDEAEARMFDVAQRRVTNSTSAIRDLLPANLDRIEMLYDRGEAITGSSTGYLDLDEKLAGLQPNSLYVVGARPAMGKALALDTAVPTPEGWSTMGELTVGDRVFDEMGQPCRVTWRSPVFLGNDCYEVVFDDGAVITADADHLWWTWDAKTRPAARTTREVAGSLRIGRDQRPNHRVPVTLPLDLPGAELPHDAYGVGRQLAGPIPPAYLRAPAKLRLALLQGLMDNDGRVLDDHTTCRIGLADPDLIMGARELVVSLGYKAGAPRTETSAPDVWVFDFTPVDPVFRHSAAAAALRIEDRPDAEPRWRHIVDVRPVPSVPTRCITVDSPNHLYLAGRDMVPTHNTAFALGMACNSAMKDNKPVLIFTLEMSNLELSQRLLCSEARVDAGRVKTGRLEEGEWNRISHAVGRLAEAPIFIDDNPHTSVMDIRAKARRLKSREGELGMVVVDYIQLMSGRASAESRQVEVSEISRNLKILARELEAPVVALAQLNRSLEQRTDKRPMLSDLRESGCLPASTRILRADNGQEVTIGELVRSNEQPIVWSMDERQRLVPAPMVKVFSTGVRPVHRLRLASGRTLEATANHPLFTAGGWRALGDLEPGELVATPRVVPPPTTDGGAWSDDELRLSAERSTTFVPPAVFAQRNAGVARFLRYLWTTGGSIAVEADGDGPPIGCDYVTGSERLAFDVQRLLLRFAIPSSIAVSKSEPAGDAARRLRFTVRIEGAGGELRFLEAVGCGGSAGGQIHEALQMVRNRRHQPPGSIDLGAAVGSDLSWDEIVSIEPVGDMPTFDATVVGTHNFVADGIVVHNSLEQDADVVLFLYRDEVYDDTSPDKGVAEVIIAKHRNGPTGKARLAFLGQYTRFENMAKSAPPGGAPSSADRPDPGSVDF